MTPLWPEELTALGDSIDSQLLEHTCKIQRNDGSLTDDYGHPKQAQWVNLHVDLPCHYWVRRERERNAADLAMAGVTNAFLLLPYGTDIHLHDRITEVKDIYGVVIARNSNIRAVMHRQGYLHIALEAVKST